MEKKIARINELAEKAKSDEGLSEEEIVERKRLREEYVASYRANLQSQLDSIVVVEKDGTRHKLKPKDLS